MGGAFGLSSLLSNLEAAAQGQGSPPRFLLMFWPCGTIPYLFPPTGTAASYVPSPILQPFETAGLREDLTVLYGLQDIQTSTGGGGHEGGVVLRTTSANIPGTRLNENGEADDAVAGGPSFDQIFTRRVPAFAELGQAPINAICDARVDSQEISAQCLSYSYDTREIASAHPAGTITEHIPLLPQKKPAELYTQLFASFMPGGSTDANRLELAKALQLRKSVLDYALGELARIDSLAPASERERIESHAAAIRKVELQLSERLSGNLDCQPPEAPNPDVMAQSGSQFYYGNPTAIVDESAMLEQIGQLHLSVIQAAFQCDIARVATFQWASSLDPVAFEGLHPQGPDAIYRHHPVSHRIVNYRTPPTNRTDLDHVQFLANVQTWYNQKTADALLSLKNTQDVFGGSLLDHTVVPYVTDVGSPDHPRHNLPALLAGGRALGLRGGQYLSYEASPRPFSDLWLSIAQAYFPEGDVKERLADEIFMKQHGSALDLIPELWVKPI